MRRALLVEWRKLRKSPVPLTAGALIVVLIPAMAFGFYSVAQGDAGGAVAQKARAMLTGSGWVGYVGGVDQIAAVAVFLGVGVVVAWTFGREHVDRTFAALFALPVSRTSIAAAKLLVLAGWVAAVALLLAAVTLGIGLIAGIEPFDGGVVGRELGRLLAVALAAGVVALPAGWVASVGRGYLPAIGALILTIAAAQVAVLFGTGGWFPFAVPGLLAVAGTEGAPVLGAAQVALVPVAAAAGAWLTVRWWGTAEVA